MNSRSYDVAGTKVVVIDADKNAEDAALKLSSSMKAAAELSAIATNPIALDCLEKYAECSNKLAKVNSLIRETLEAQEVVLKFVTKLDVTNAVKSTLPALRKFKELKTLFSSIVLPTVDDNLKKILNPSIIQGTTQINSQKELTTKNYQSCVQLNETIMKCAKMVVDKKANPNGAAAPVQPAPAANANPPAFMHSNTKSAEAAKAAAAKPGVQPLPPNNNQKQK